jgi:hypothetical protein
VDSLHLLSAAAASVQPVASSTTVRLVSCHATAAATLVSLLEGCSVLDAEGTSLSSPQVVPAPIIKKTMSMPVRIVAITNGIRKAVPHCD